jgi:hypothetical protein
MMVQSEHLSMSNHCFLLMPWQQIDTLLDRHTQSRMNILINRLKLNGNI